MASYATKVKSDIARWVSLGLVDATTADALSRDIEANDRRSISFGSILATMAALLFGAAILLFVAANWEAFPRLMRVGVLFAIIFGGYVGGAVLKGRDHAAIGEALWLVAAAAFGGAIALIGQMYHMTGDEAGAVLVWCIGTSVAAAALRSNPLTVAAVGLADAWLFLKGFEIYRESEFPHWFIAMAVVLWALSLWTRSEAARHLLLLSVVMYIGLMATHYDFLGVAIGLSAGSAVLLALALYLPGPVDRVVQLGGRLPIHCLIAFLVGIAMWQVDRMDDSGFVIAAVAALAVIAGAIIFGGRESRGLRWIAYAGFAFELCIVYAVTMGTMLGTAGFFLAAGVILGLLAFIIIRIEKQMKSGQVGAGSAAG